MVSRTASPLPKYGVIKGQDAESSKRIPAVRINVTSRCNFNCFYCTPAGESYCGEEKENKESILDEENLSNVLLALEKLGFMDIRWTGGEPLLVWDLLSKVMERMKKEAPSLKFGITTNGFFLNKYAESIKDSNLSELIVSLDSLERENFKQMSNADGLEKVVSGIKSLKDTLPVRLNVVVSKKNFHERWAFIDFAIANGLSVKFLDMDYFRNPGVAVWDENFIALTPFVEEMKQKYPDFEEVWRTGKTGIPMVKIMAGDTMILMKDSTRGTHYSLGCDECPLYPTNAGAHYCQEGLYEMFITVDGKATICKHRSDMGVNLKNYDFSNVGSLETGLKKMLDYYNHLTYRSRTG